MRKALPALTLMLLAAAIPELLSGSTPIASFFMPIQLFLNLFLYGCAAVLIRDFVRRYELGWPTVFLLGCAYGILEEGLWIQSFFNVNHPDLGILKSYGRVWSVNWVWAVQLTVFHATCSMVIPIAIAEMLFPARRKQPWLSQGGVITICILFTINIFGGGALLTFVWRTRFGYHVPWMQWSLFLAIMLAIIAIAVTLPRPRSMVGQRPPPKLWKLRVASFVIWCTFFLMPGIYANEKGVPRASFPVAIITTFVIVTLAFFQIKRWSERSSTWDDRHRLAISTGPILFLALLSIIFTPFMSSPDKSFAGQWTMGILGIVLFVLLTMELNRRLRSTDLPGFPVLPPVVVDH